jgi:SAM-dependent methyltransferase
MTEPPGYVLGSDEAEIARLDGQASAIALPTRLLLQLAGIGVGMRVLDLGTGLGHVAFQAGELVGPEGSVLGIDREGPLLAVAESRRTTGTVAFAEADALSFRDDEPFDAIMARLLLFHLPDPVAALRHHRATVAPGGLFVAIDFDCGTARAEPPVPLVATALGWIEAAFRASGADPRVGAALGPLLSEAGFEGVQTLGIQAYFAPDSGHGPALICGVVRSLAGAIVAHGIASEDELGLASLEERMRQQVAAAGAVVLAPGLVGAWARAPR